MRIGFDAKRLYCNFTGLGNYSRTLVKNLWEQFPDNNYFLYSPKQKQHPDNTYFIHHPHIQSFIPKALLKSKWRSYGITKQLVADKIELYHGLSHELPFNIHKTDIKTVVTIHDLIFKIYPDNYPSLDRKMYDRKFKFACEKADKVIAISESTKQDIIHFYGIDPNKIQVVYQSVNYLYFSESDIQEKEAFVKERNLPDKFLLYVGSVEARKNLMVVIEALKLIPKANRIPLLVVGKETSYKEEVLKKIEEYKLQSDVIWLERLVSNKQLKYLYEEASVFIYPSVYEGFGLPVAEALLSKTPVITSNVSSLPEAAGPASVCMDPYDKKGIADAIVAITSDNNLSEEMIEKGYTYAQQNFNAEICTQKIHQVYLELMS